MMPRWLTWLFLLCLAYMAYVASTVRDPSAVKGSPVLAENESFWALGKTLDPEQWKRRINPDYVGKSCALPERLSSEVLAVTLIEDKPGTGAGAACGDTITVELAVWNAAGTHAERTTQELVLGDALVASGLSYGLVGIRLQGVRTLLLPPYALKGKKTLPGYAGKDLAVVTVTRMK